MILKLRTSKGNLTIDNVSSDSNLYILKSEISSKTKISYPSIVIKYGFPPKLITSSDETFLSEIGISSGDTLIIEEDISKKSIESESKKIDNEKKPINPKKDLEKIDVDQMPNKEGLIMIRRIIPADNSCLFNAILYAIEHKTKIKTEPIELRKIIASYIMSDPETYNESILEKSNQKYCDWILIDSSWGGDIELSILSKFFDIEICAVSIRNCEIFKYGSSNNRIFLLFDGIHYDVLARNISDDMDQTKDETIFKVQDLYAEKGAIVLANQLRKQKMFTDLENFTLQCGICSKGLKGEKEAVEHNKSTGHMNFQEINKK